MNRRTAVISALIVLLTACGTGDKSPIDPGEQTRSGEMSDVGDVEAFVAETSARTLELETIKSRFTLDVEGSDGSSVRVSGDFEARGPDLYGQLRTNGIRSDVLVIGGDGYVRVDGQWYLVPTDVARGELERVRRYGEHRSAIDFEGLASGITGLEQLADESIDDDQAVHVRGEMAFSDFISRSAFVTSDVVDLVDNASPITVDLWIDAETLLPVRAEFAYSFDIYEETVDSRVAVEYTEFDGEVSIPDRPINVPLLSAPPSPPTPTPTQKPLWMAPSTDGPLTPTALADRLPSLDPRRIDVIRRNGGVSPGACTDVAIEIVDSPIGRLFHEGEIVELHLRYTADSCYQVSAWYFGYYVEGSPVYQQRCPSGCGPYSRTNFYGQPRGVSGTGEVRIVPPPGPLKGTLTDAPASVDGFVLCSVDLQWTGQGSNEAMRLGTPC